MLGPGFTLLNLTGNQRLTDGVARAADHRGVPLSCLDLGDTGLMVSYEAEAILVRPDHFVAWAGTAQSADPAHILDRAIGNSGGAS